MIRILTGLLIFLSTQVYAETMKLAVTTSFHNSGLSDVLLPAIKADTGIDVQLLIVGTGQAIRLGEAGDVDAILVHSRQAEDAFVAQGFGTYRHEIMYNDFVLVGPASDPAQISDANTAAEALTRIASAKVSFVSRGDDSGTHKKELGLWASAGLDAADFDSWYKAVGAGMGASLNTAAGFGAYIMTDRASWLNFRNQNGLEILFSGDPELFNQYAYLPVNPKRHTHTNAKAADALDVWLRSEKAARLMEEYKINGQALFVFNAKR